MSGTTIEETCQNVVKEKETSIDQPLSQEEKWNKKKNKVKKGEILQPTKISDRKEKLPFPSMVWNRKTGIADYKNDKHLYC